MKLDREMRAALRLMRHCGLTYTITSVRKRKDETEENLTPAEGKTKLEREGLRDDAARAREETRRRYLAQSPDKEWWNGKEWVD